MHEKLAAAAAPAGILALALILTGCAGASLSSIAEECGGRAAGIHVDDSGLLVDVGQGSDGLVCVLPKVFPDDSDQYLVTLTLDSGESQEMEVDGRSVKVGNLDGSQFVFIQSDD